MTIEKYFVLTIALLMIIAPITVYPDKDENKEEDDKQYVDEKCDASEDYEANKKECDKLYDALEEDEKDNINSFEDGILSKETNKNDCEEESGKWVDGECDLDEEQY